MKIPIRRYYTLIKKQKINILVMPTDQCNMNCIYCFHNPYHEKQGKMSRNTLSQIFKVVFKTYQDVTFIWHGGEPMAMGLHFFQDVISMQNQYKNVKIENRMQSNLTLLTDEMADFFRNNNFKIGTSFDGVKNEQLRGNSKKILMGREKLLTRGKTCGFIMVISKKNIDTLIESYELFKRLNANYTINTYVSTTMPNNHELELEPDNAAAKIIEFYEYWLKDTECKIHISYFERILSYILSGKKSVCKYNSCLGKWIGIRYDGSVVPCNRYFPDEYTYGNVWDMEEISNAFESEGFRRLLTEAIARREKCIVCPIFHFCTGGCNNVALNENGISNNGGSSCQILKNVYFHIKNSIYYVILENNFNGINPSVINLIKNRDNSRKEPHYDMHCDSYIP